MSKYFNLWAFQQQAQYLKSVRIWESLKVPQRMEYEIWEEKKLYSVIQILKMKGKTVKIQKALRCDSNLLQYGMTGFMCYVKTAE